MSTEADESGAVLAPPHRSSTVGEDQPGTSGKSEFAAHLRVAPNRSSTVGESQFRAADMAFLVQVILPDGHIELCAGDDVGFEQMAPDLTLKT